MKKITNIVLSFAMAAGILAGPLITTTAVGAVDPSAEIQKGVKSAGGDGADDDIGPAVKTIINTLLYVLGAIAVLMIVIGGIRYTLSGGDSSQTKSAKDTILYAVIGLVVAILAYAIVNFVINAFK